MNKVIIGGLAAVLVIGTAAVIIVGGDKDPEDINSNFQATSTPIEPDQQEQSSQSKPVENEGNGSYVDYDEESLLASADTKRIVFFHAEWCSTCRFYEGQIESQGVPQGVTILKADYDSEVELKTRYGVTVQSTFVLLDADGNVERAWPFASGLRSIDDLYQAVI